MGLSSQCQRLTHNAADKISTQKEYVAVRKGSMAKRTRGIGEGTENGEGPEKELPSPS